ncbi:hypothetical protein EJD97_006585 [Solanum chilense]|uniref:Uncharacterized protein n=1 Tax=Solanum chilense TaxID=4083 RepID=A0A6N2BQ53_SOLCI|nr:hypothetical protein EJD97_006585 [Solanum chilense]
MGRIGVMANRLHRKGIKGSPQKFFLFLTPKSRSPKKWFAIAHENRLNGGYACFGACLTLKKGETVREGKPDA